jgi:hypothetical protein
MVGSAEDSRLVRSHLFRRSAQGRGAGGMSGALAVPDRDGGTPHRHLGATFGAYHPVMMKQQWNSMLAPEMLYRQPPCQGVFRRQNGVKGSLLGGAPQIHIPLIRGALSAFVRSGFDGFAGILPHSRECRDHTPHLCRNCGSSARRRAWARGQMARPRSSLLGRRSPASQRASSLCASARRAASISATSSGSWVNSTISPSGEAT